MSMCCTTMICTASLMMNSTSSFVADDYYFDAHTAADDYGCCADVEGVWPVLV